MQIEQYKQESIAWAHNGNHAARVYEWKWPKYALGMNAARPINWRKTVVLDAIISVAWNSLYIFASLPGGAPQLKKAALGAWGLFAITAFFMLPYLLLGLGGLVFRIGNFNKTRLTKVALAFGIFTAVTILALVIGAKVSGAKK